MAPVVVMVNVAEESTPNDGRHEGGPYDVGDRLADHYFHTHEKEVQ